MSETSLPSGDEATCLDAALALARQGAFVLPIWWVNADGSCGCDRGASCSAKPGKHPLQHLVPHGLNDSTNDLDTIKEWFDRYPQANLGLDLARSNLMAFDVDEYHGDTAKITTVERQLGELPESILQKSGSGEGYHGVYKKPDHDICGLFNGVVIRGKNYIVVAPSNHVSGNKYEWIEGRSPLDREPAELPLLWAEALRKTATVGAAGMPDHDQEPPYLQPISNEARLVAMRKHLEAEHGEVHPDLATASNQHRVRPGMLFDVVRSAVRGNAVRDPEAALQLLIEIYNPKCEPPYAEEKLARAVWSAYERGRAPQWGQNFRPRLQIPKAKSPIANTISQALGMVASGTVKDPPVTAPTEPRPVETATLLEDEIVAVLQTARDRTKRRMNPHKKLEGRLLAKILAAERLTAQHDETTDQAIEKGIAVVIKYAPPAATPGQLCKILQSACFPLAPDVLHDLVTGQKVAAQSGNQPAEPDPTAQPPEPGEFEIDQKTGGPKNSPHNIRTALERLGVTFQYDEFGDRELVLAGGDIEAEVVEDHHINTFRLAIDAQFGFLPQKDLFFDVCSNLARQNAFDPVCDYLETNQPGWDGVTRIGGPDQVSWLTTYGGAEDSAYTRAVGRHILVAAVRRARQPGAKFDEMLILESHQGALKSSAIAALCPRPDWFGDELPFDASTQRQMEATAGKWIMEASENKGLSNADVAKMKSYLSRQRDECRAAYGRKNKIAPRRFVIIGTTNEKVYARDNTGDRRLWPVEVTVFDVQAITRDRDQIWAEAAYYESLGESIRLDPKLYPDATVEQEKRRIVDVFEVVLSTELPAEGSAKIKVLDLWKILGIDAVEATQAQSQRLTAVMTRLGWKHSRRTYKKQSVYCYVRGDATADGNGGWIEVAGNRIVGGVKVLPLTPNQSRSN